MTAPQPVNNLARLRLLGTFALHGNDGKLIAIVSKKNRALLAVLALSPSFRATRERLAGLLWGDRGDEQARDSLRQSIAVLRKDLGENASFILKSTGDLIELRPEIITIDVTEFLATKNEDNVETLRRAAAIYAGDLLTELTVREAAFEDWLAAEHRRLNATAIKLFDRLAALEVGQAQIDAAQRLLALDQLREASHRRLMNAYAAQGEKALALQQYDQCEKLLLEELKVEPANETRELRRAIAAGKSHHEKLAVIPKERVQNNYEDSRPSIAVLPFVSLSDDPTQNYFSDGVTGDIITELTRWRLLSVRSRWASFRFRNRSTDIKQIAAELNVRYIVDGSVRRLGERIRFTAQLIDTESGNQIWAEKFDRQQSDIFLVQDEVVRTIVSTLVGRVQFAAAEIVTRKPPANLAAYECVLKANALTWSDPLGLAEATRLFAKAIELDPSYGMAHAMLSVMYLWRWLDDLHDITAPPQELFALAQRAVDLDSNDSTCFAVLGFTCLYRRSFDLALQYAKRAIEINPNNQWTIADMGIFQLLLGDAETALGWLLRAREIDPYFDPSWYWSGLGQTYMMLHRFEEALAAFEHFPSANYWVAARMAGCYAALSDMNRAATLAATCMALKPDFKVSHRMSKEPYKNPADAASLTLCLSIAGLPI